MKENEKNGILILATIAIVVIVVLIMILPHDKGKKEVATSQSQTQGQVQKELTANNNQNTDQQTEKTKVNGSGEKVNTSEKINTTKETEEFTLSNVSLKETNGETVLSARITNKSGRKQEGFFGNIILLDKSNKEIGKIPVKVSEMNANETREISASITESYIEAYDYKIEK